MKIVIGLLLGACIGIVCRLAGIPLPAPPVLVGALLVLAMTCGYILVDRFAVHRAAHTRHLCGGPTGDTTAGETAHGGGR